MQNMMEQHYENVWFNHTGLNYTIIKIMIL
jgi:hypothetical protein